MATCPSCRRHYADDVQTCGDDGAQLVPDATFASVDKDLEPGTVVGEYRVEAKVGEGGFGSVYRASHPVIGRTVAVKVLNRQFSSNPEMVSRFIAEARAANQIRSRFIIDIFGFGALADGRQYYVMEHLDGVTLDRYLAERGRLSLEEAIPILRGIARGLDAAHDKGIVHRDLKPENVFIVADEEGQLQAKLLDFGIAKLVGDAERGHKTRTGVPIGTPYYMSPEQCRGDRIDHRTDIYSFGVVCQQLLTGRLPFYGDSFMKVMMLHTGATPPPPTSQCPELPLAIDAAVASMLAKEPEDRPASAGAALEGLAAIAQEAGHRVSVRPISKQTPALTPHRLTPQFTPSQVLDMSEAATAIDPAAAGTLSATETAALAGPKRRSLWLAAVAVVVVLVAGAALFKFRDRGGRAKAAKAAAANVVAAPVATKPKPAPRPPPAAPSPPPAPSQVSLSIQSTPAEVEVYDGDTKLGLSSEVIRVPRADSALMLTFKADGYKDAQVKVTPSANAVVSVKLSRKPRPQVRKSGVKQPDDLEF